MPAVMQITAMCKLLLSVTLTGIILFAFSQPAWSDPAIETRKRLLENQRNMLRLEQEKQLFEKELQLTLTRQRLTNESLQGEIDTINNYIKLLDTVMDNVLGTISRQRLLLSTMERGAAPSTLDMALNKALKVNLSDLSEKLANNEDARDEIVSLRLMLKEQAGIGNRLINADNTIPYAAEQQLAEEEYLRLLELISNSSGEPAEDKNITITGFIDNQPVIRERTLSYLGQHQYHMETTVNQGKMTFTIDGRPWHMTIDPEDNQSTYVVIYDMTKTDQPRLVIFNKALLVE